MSDVLGNGKKVNVTTAQRSLMEVFLHLNIILLEPDTILNLVFRYQKKLKL